LFALGISENFMFQTAINTENTVFVLLSFEGPDVYSQAGGLGVRVTNLSQTLAREGFSTHFFFIGDPHLKGEDFSCRGKLVLHRWCQWISQYHSAGVYQGEEEKLADYNKSIPSFLLEHIIRPARSENKIVVILAEEWQTAEVVCRISALLYEHNLRDRVVIFWNANNIFGFERINFKNLIEACTLTTVSRYMKHIMWRMGLNPLVIHNGIPKNLLNRVDLNLSARLRKGLNSDLVLAKIARWDPDKRWNMAIEATAGLKARGLRTTLLARGGIESYGDEILSNARSLGLKIKNVTAKGEKLDDYLEALAANSEGADILNLKFHCPQDFLRLIYHASDAILANSGREPFGLVGLETMAAGGIAFTGSTGEDYAISFHNSIVLDTSDPEEIESYVVYLSSHKDEGERIRKAARHTAARFTWEQIAESLIQRLECQAKMQGLIEMPETGGKVPNLSGLTSDNAVILKG
jgi:glycosyltransferase involved in cell wall biosynthesis